MRFVSETNFLLAVKQRWEIENRVCINQVNEQAVRHAGLDPASSDFLDCRLRGNDMLRVFIRRSSNVEMVFRSQSHGSILILPPPFYHFHKLRYD